MPRAVRFSRYGGPEVLHIAEVDEPEPRPGEIVVAVEAAAINPGEIGIREGAFADLWPAHFPEGQGNDYAGTVHTVGPGVTTFRPGDEVMGFAPRAAQADFVRTRPDRLARKPRSLDWAQAAVIPGVGATAYAETAALQLSAHDTVVISAGAGGVGSIAIQLAHHRGATVIATGSKTSFPFLESLGAIPVEYGEGLADRIREATPAPVTAYLDHFGRGNVATALELGVPPTRINTLADGAAVARRTARSVGQAEADTPEIWETLAAMAVSGDIAFPIDSVYPLDEVRAAYIKLAERHTHGKIALTTGRAVAPTIPPLS
ncbi:alcohol dehydrogenase GroES domain protein [Streptomyces davaonensis JCM 4913]|uniref:Alcohol dehydrogenase GroES domain protein n=1 Tax=Streptomyces davaonensis (strain DSM 101723 / JCM 4913 / KCC S-0913 / 768) TaxID=1214101 RepID=K4R6X0_STRDJ|nr:NADP-dependent oxidoreductase [Streptomyces davaonensis]CCK28837.1 alcohol dehydrogenase GroES domain protein [Streptomyces davaonensis JCM 4913]